jgi:hypothetical protein
MCTRRETAKRHFSPIEKHDKDPLQLHQNISNYTPSFFIQVSFLLNPTSLLFLFLLHHFFVVIVLSKISAYDPNRTN